MSSSSKDYFVNNSFKIHRKKCQFCFNDTNVKEDQIFCKGVLRVPINGPLMSHLIPELSLTFFILCDNPKCERNILLNNHEIPGVVKIRICNRKNSYFHVSEGKCSCHSLIHEKNIRYDKSRFHVFMHTDCWTKCTECQKKSHFHSSSFPKIIRKRVIENNIK